MNRPQSAILAGIICLSTAAPAADVVGQATMNARQIRTCMGKQMSSDRSVSYNKAKRLCAERLKAQNQPASPPLGSISAGGGK